MTKQNDKTTSNQTFVLTLEQTFVGKANQQLTFGLLLCWLTE